jgi:protein transport protein HofC
MSAKQLWRWQGINNKGKSLEGTLWADTRPSLMLALEKQQITPLRIKRMRVKTSHWSRTRSAETIHQLATLLKAGLTLSTGLALLAEQHPSSQWQALLRTLAYDMEQGITLSTSLSQWQHVFPPLYQAMIRTGELTGKLDDCCFELAYQQKKQQQLADKVKKPCAIRLSSSQWRCWSYLRCCSLYSLSLPPSTRHSTPRYRPSLSGLLPSHTIAANGDGWR